MTAHTFAGATGTNTISDAGGYDPYNQSPAYFVDASGNPHVLILRGWGCNLR